ncbi:MAG: arginase family protein [Candidatus Woesearchaeota archaeon]|nr:arginase family protein [Candidatus Woesearchaeota archaeon]
MERILLVDYREGSAFEGPIGPDFISFGNYKTLREVSSSLDHPHIFFPECNSQVNAEVQKRQMICFLKEQSKKGTLLVSRDHVMSYHFATGILKNEQKQGKKYGKIGYLVVDQHMDIYSHSTNGEDINKATVFRDLIEKGFVDLAVFIGIRPLEESLYHEIGGLKNMPPSREAGASCQDWKAKS